MRKIVAFALFAGCILIAGCNTVRGAGEDIDSVGRVFSDNPDGTKK